MEPDLLSIVLTVFGLFTLLAIHFKPDFYWERGRMQHRRKLIGDRNTEIMYYVLGAIMLIAGLLDLFGVY